MYKRVIIVIFLLFFYLESKSQKDTLFVSLKIENKEIKVNDNVDIYIVYNDSIGKHIIKPILKKNYFFISKFNTKTSGVIVLGYKNYYLGLPFSDFRFSQNMRLEFGWHSKPFLEDSNDIFYQTPNNALFLVYLKYNPLEKGNGIIRTSWIFNKKDYINSIQEYLH